MANGISFKLEPRHVEMFGPTGILAPLYARQQTKMALAEKERQQQSEFEQMKALNEQRAQLEMAVQAASSQGQYYLAQAEQERARTAELQRQATATQKWSSMIQEGVRTGNAKMVQEGMLGIWAETGQAAQIPVGLYTSAKPVAGPSEFSVVLDEQGRPQLVPGRIHWPPEWMFGGAEGGMTPYQQKQFQRVERNSIISNIGTQFGTEKMPGEIADVLGVEKQPIDRYLQTFVGHPWSPDELDAVNKLRASTHPTARAMVNILDRIYDLEGDIMQQVVPGGEAGAGKYGWGGGGTQTMQTPTPSPQQLFPPFTPQLQPMGTTTTGFWQPQAIPPTPVPAETLRWLKERELWKRRTPTG